MRAFIKWKMRHLIRWYIELRALRVRIHSRIVGYPVGCYVCGDPSCYSCNLVYDDEEEVV